VAVLSLQYRCSRWAQPRRIRHHEVNTDPDLGNLLNVCQLVADTNGEQITPGACKNDLDNGDNDIVDYLLRNCDRNETALLRKASSAVLSLSDYLIKSKEKQQATAGAYLCSYAGKYAELEGAGKLSSESDLGMDAEGIADDIGAPCL